MPLGCRAVGRTQVHPDAGPHLQTKTFAMSLLIDLYHNHSKGYSVLPSVAHTITDGDKFANYRAGSALTKNAAAAHPDRAEMERLIGVVNGVEVQLTEQEVSLCESERCEYAHPMSIGGRCGPARWTLFGAHCAYVTASVHDAR
jgi:hypothetical protein